MKRKALGLLLFLLIVPMFIACGQETTTIAQKESPKSTTVEFALGEVTFEIITAGDDLTTTDVTETEYVSNRVIVDFFEGDTLFELLFDNFTMSCQSEDGNPDDTCAYVSQYGHYVQGIDTLVITESNQFIAFYIDGAQAPTGVDSTDLTDGTVYQFKIDTF